MEITTRTIEETMKLGADLAAKVTDGGILCLYGDLGSGKTTLTQGIAQALGIARRVPSPSFVVMRRYLVNDKTVYHIDLYRLEKETEMRDIGLVEIFEDPENIVIIEWAEKLKGLLPEKRIDVHLLYVNDEERRITVTDYA